MRFSNFAVCSVSYIALTLFHAELFVHERDMLRFIWHACKLHMHADFVFKFEVYACRSRLLLAGSLAALAWSLRANVFESVGFFSELMRGACADVVHAAVRGSS